MKTSLALSGSILSIFSILVLLTYKVFNVTVSTSFSGVIVAFFMFLLILGIILELIVLFFKKEGKKIAMIGLVATLVLFLITFFWPYPIR